MKPSHAASYFRLGKMYCISKGLCHSSGGEHRVHDASCITYDIPIFSPLVSGSASVRRSLLSSNPFMYGVCLSEQLPHLERAHPPSCCAAAAGCWQRTLRQPDDTATRAEVLCSTRMLPLSIVRHMYCCCCCYATASQVDNAHERMGTGGSNTCRLIFVCIVQVPPSYVSLPVLCNATVLRS